MRAPAPTTAKPLVFRPLRAAPYYIFSQVAPEGRQHSSVFESVSDRLRTIFAWFLSFETSLKFRSAE